MYHKDRLSSFLTLDYLDTTEVDLQQRLRKVIEQRIVSGVLTGKILDQKAIPPSVLEVLTVFVFIYDV